MTLIATILRGCGLSQREAADFLGVRLDTLKSWSAGRNPTPQGALDQLHELATRQEQVASEAVEIWQEQGEPSQIEIGIASDDHEAQSLGWPCVGAHAAVARRVWEILPQGVAVRIVPRGSTAT